MCGCENCLVGQILTSGWLEFDTSVVFINDFLTECQKLSLSCLDKYWQVSCLKKLNWVVIGLLLMGVNGWLITSSKIMKVE